MTEDKKPAEEALRESEEKWRSLVQNAPAVVMTIERDGTITFINRAVVPELSVEDVVGTNVRDYIVPGNVDKAMHAIEEVFATGEPTDYEVSGAGPHGSTAHYSTRIGPIMRDGEVVSTIQTTRDITERKRAEEEIARLNDELKRRVPARSRRCQGRASAGSG